MVLNMLEVPLQAGTLFKDTIGWLPDRAWRISTQSPSSSLKLCETQDAQYIHR